MSLKIIMKPIQDNSPYINVGDNVRVFDIESGVEISDYIQSIDIRIRRDDWVTATIECDVGELELNGIKISEIK